MADRYSDQGRDEGGRGRSYGRGGRGSDQGGRSRSQYGQRSARLDEDDDDYARHFDQDRDESRGMGGYGGGYGQGMSGQTYGGGYNERRGSQGRFRDDDWDGGAGMEGGRDYFQGQGRYSQGGQGYSQSFGQGGYGGTQGFGGESYGQGGRSGQGQGGYGGQSYGQPGMRGGRGQGGDWGGQGQSGQNFGQGSSRGSNEYGGQWGSSGRNQGDQGYGGGSQFGGMARSGYEQGYGYMGQAGMDQGFSNTSFGPGRENRGGQQGYLSRGGRQQWGQHSGRGPKNYTRSDDRIRDDINDRLTDDPEIDASEIEVKVSSCEVTLSGMVDSRDAKRRAEDLAESISGVKHVQNNLRVQAASNTSAEDTATRANKRGGKSDGDSEKMQ
jgi:osmotically-inducible protein OsmY